MFDSTDFHCGRLYMCDSTQAWAGDQDFHFWQAVSHLAGCIGVTNTALL